MDKSILNTIKKLLGGIEADCTDFDSEIIAQINTAFMFLRQMGVGPVEGFSIEDSTAIWSDFITEIQNFEAVKTYIHLKVKLVFDPPASATVIQAYKETIAECEWRLNATAETNC